MKKLDLGTQRFRQGPEKSLMKSNVKAPNYTSQWAVSVPLGGT